MKILETIPGTPKPTLLKPGADKLCELYGLADDYLIESKVEDFASGLFDYTVKCSLISKRGGFLVATGYGSCNSFEKKYRWRDGQKKCPSCGKETIIKGKSEYGGGWLCFAKKGGCGTKYADGDQSIEGQATGKIVNDDIADQKNTVLKMAKKRAKIDATLSATRSSGVFTQDLEDMPTGDTGKAEAPKNIVFSCEDVDGKIIVNCVPREVAEKTTKSGANYLAVKLNGEINGRFVVLCYDEKLWQSIKGCVGRDCRFVVEGGDYPRLIQVLQIGQVTYAVS